MSGTHCYIPQCINRVNGHDHLQTTNSCVSRALGVFCVTSSPRHELRSTLNAFFFLILWLFDLSALLLVLAFPSSSCLIYKFISKHTRNNARCYELMCASEWWRILHGSSLFVGLAFSGPLCSITTLRNLFV